MINPSFTLFTLPHLKAFQPLNSVFVPLTMVVNNHLCPQGVERALYTNRVFVYICVLLEDACGIKYNDDGSKINDNNDENSMIIADFMSRCKVLIRTTEDHFRIPSRLQVKSTTIELDTTSFVSTFKPSILIRSGGLKIKSLLKPAQTAAIIAYFQRFKEVVTQSNGPNQHDNIVIPPVTLPVIQHGTITEHDVEMETETEEIETEIEIDMAIVAILKNILMDESIYTMDDGDVISSCAKYVKYHVKYVILSMIDLPYDKASSNMYTYAGKLIGKQLKEWWDILDGVYLSIPSNTTTIYPAIEELCIKMPYGICDDHIMSKSLQQYLSEIDKIHRDKLIHSFTDMEMKYIVFNSAYAFASRLAKMMTNQNTVNVLQKLGCKGSKAVEAIVELNKDRLFGNCATKM